MAFTRYSDFDVANPTSVENKQFTVRFPGAELLSLGWVEADYADVHVYDGATALACSATATQLTVSYPSMPLGRRTLRVHIGDPSASAPAAPSTGSATVQAVEPREFVTVADSTVNVILWGEDLDTTTLSQAAPTTYYGSATTHTLGKGTGSSEWRYLCKPLVGMLPKGTVTSAALHLHLTPLSYTENGTLQLHALSDSRVDYNYPTGGFFPWGVANGWSNNDQAQLPTWNTRFYDYQPTDTGNTVAWVSAGANDYDSGYTSVSLTAGFTAGYRQFSIPAATVSAWVNTDHRAQGVLIRDPAAAGNSRTVTANGTFASSNRPFLVVTYSQLDSDQLSKRKVTSDTYCYATFSTQEDFLVVASDNHLGVLLHVNAEMRYDVFYLSHRGRLSRCARNIRHGTSRFDQTGQCGGLYYDEVTGRYSTMGTTHPGHVMALAESAPHLADSWTWYTASFGFYKGQMLPRNGTYYFFAAKFSPSDVPYFWTFTPPSTWSAQTALASANARGTMRALSSTVSPSATSLPLNGSVADYPDFGVALCGSEYITWESVDRGTNTLLSVHRGQMGTTAASRSAGTTVSLVNDTQNYCTIRYDAANNGFHVLWNSNGSYSSYFGYTDVWYAFRDSAGTWRDGPGGTALTLPITSASGRRTSKANPPGTISYAMDMRVLADGTVEVLNSEPAWGPSSLLGSRTAWKSVRSTSGTWTHTEIGSIHEASFSGDIITGVSDPYGVSAGRQTVYASEGQVIPLSTMDWGGETPLWLSSAAERTVSGTTIMYAMHDTHHGFLYLDALSGLTVTPSTQDTYPLGTIAFVADIGGTPVSPTWSATGGTITNAGLFTAGWGSTYTVTATYNGQSVTVGGSIIAATVYADGHEIPQTTVRTVYADGHEESTTVYLTVYADGKEDTPYTLLTVYADGYEYQVPAVWVRPLHGIGVGRPSLSPGRGSARPSL